MTAATDSEDLNLREQLPVLEALQWSPGETILDIGCGPGAHCAYFASKGLTPIGLDRNPEIFAQSFRHAGDVSELNGETFDNVFASHVLEHCPNTFDTLASWRALLKPGGRMIIFVPPWFPQVANDHWINGWNAGQLGVSMVASGFDCRKGCFGSRGIQVWGCGVKAEFPPTGFMFDAALHWLPQTMREARLDYGAYQLLQGALAWCDETRIEFLYGCQPAPDLVKRWP